NALLQPRLERQVQVLSGQVDADVATSVFRRCEAGGAGATERVEHGPAGLAAREDAPLGQRERHDGEVGAREWLGCDLPHVTGVAAARIGSVVVVALLAVRPRTSRPIAVSHPAPLRLLAVR